MSHPLPPHPPPSHVHISLPSLREAGVTAARGWHARPLLIHVHLYVYARLCGLL